jgi:Flp pilus assembly protein TadB
VPPDERHRADSSSLAAATRGARVGRTSDRLLQQRRQEGSLKNVLFLIAAILLAVWIVGLVFDIIGGIIHILLVVAVALFLFGFLKRKVRT